MGLGEGNQAWAGTSAWMSLNIVHADNSFRLLKRHWLPYTCMLLCLTPRLCCVLPFFSPFRGEREAACLYVNANPCRVLGGGCEGNKAFSPLYLRSGKFEMFHSKMGTSPDFFILQQLVWIVAPHQRISTSCIYQRLSVYWDVACVCKNEWIIKKWK